MFVTQAIVNGQRHAFVKGAGVSRVKRGLRRNVVRGVQVHHEVRAGGLACRHLRGRDGQRNRVCALLNGRRGAGCRVAGHLHTLHVHQVAFFVQFELAVTAVEHAAVAVEQTEETVLADSHVQLTAGVGGHAVAEVLGDTRNFNAEARFRTGKHVGERDGARLKTISGGVGNVVADNVEVGAGSIQTADRL
ncbi:hypothetical protein BN130_193 [Cronobacter malonaticus 507]|nr:hypothetical protein BN131_3991 [Cronobacter malonaticus 681]CCJ97728.1 hypothetical protein BN130_193 [Cronobacter malonaticus 507]